MAGFLTIPECKLAVGDPSSFAMEAVIPSASVNDSQFGSSAILSITNGYFTFFAAGVNILKIEPERTSGNQPMIHDYTAMSLSMVLEWIYFDRAYELESAAKSFAAIVGGESSPDISFRLAEDVVTIDWNLKDWSRIGRPYVCPQGRASVDYLHFLACLAQFSEGIIVISRQRAVFARCLSEWDQWLSGYQRERDMFHEFLIDYIKRLTAI